MSDDIIQYDQADTEHPAVSSSTVSALEPAPEPAVAPAPAASAESPVDSVIDNWLSIEFPGTIFADTPEKWNDLRAKVGNLKNALKIKE